METYIIFKETNDEIILKPFHCNFKYNVEKLDDGTMIYKRIKEIIIKKEEDLVSRDFTYSKLVECMINGRRVDINSYRGLLKHIYNFINDGVQIIKHTTENIKIGKHTDKGFVYLENLGISFHNNNSKYTLKEIFHQCEMNNIKIECKILLN